MRDLLFWFLIAVVPLDGLGDRAPVRQHRVNRAWLFGWPALLTVLLGWLHLALAVRPQCGGTLFHQLRWREDERLDVGGQMAPDDLLTSWADGDDPLVSVVLRLVLAWPVEPDDAGDVDVTRSHGDQLAGAHARFKLQADHVGQHRAQDIQRVVNYPPGPRA